MILWQLPLAFASFIFHRVVKFAMRGLIKLHDARNRGEARKWLLLADLVARPAAMPVIMTTGPRWNTHAIIATLSPVSVNKTLEIDVASAERSARSWTIVVCTYPEQRTVTSVGTLASPFPNGTAQLQLAPGKYWLGLRYYEWKDDVELPAVRADGRTVSESLAVPADANGFYRDLQKKNSNLFYVALHYYVFVLLRYRIWFPQKFVEREFLPLGNPETNFYFGALRQGERLNISFAPRLSDGWNVLLTLYDTGSFPIASEHIRKSGYEIAADRGDCTYLVRVHRVSAPAEPFDRKWLNVTVKPC